MVRHAFFAFSAALFFAAAAGQSDVDGSSASSYRSNVADGLRAAAGYRTGVAADADDGGAAGGVYRLPAGVTPVSYALRVDTDMDNLSYSGGVDIAIVSEVTPKLCRIVLNAKDLRVTDVRVTDVNTGTRLTVADRWLADDDEQLIVTLEGRCLLPERRYEVAVDFQAPLRDDMSGYYRSSYLEGNVTKYT